MSVCLSIRMNAVISKTISAPNLGFRKTIKFPTPTITPSNLKKRKYGRGYIGNYQRKTIEVSDLDSLAFLVQVCYANMPRPF